jgi:hypothetical protein
VGSLSLLVFLKDNFIRSCWTVVLYHIDGVKENELKSKNVSFSWATHGNSRSPQNNSKFQTRVWNMMLRASQINARVLFNKGIWLINYPQDTDSGYRCLR